MREKTSHRFALRQLFSYLDDDKIFVNTGTWTNMYNLDFGRHSENTLLTYAQVDILSNKNHSYKDNLKVSLNVWKGKDRGPFYQYS